MIKNKCNSQIKIIYTNKYMFDLKHTTIEDCIFIANEDECIDAIFIIHFSLEYE